MRYPSEIVEGNHKGITKGIVNNFLFEESPSQEFPNRTSEEISLEISVKNTARVRERNPRAIKKDIPKVIAEAIFK